MNQHAPSLARRNRHFLLALAPGAGVLAWQQPRLLVTLAISALLALALDAACLRLRRQPVRAHLLEGSALRAALLLALWFPAIGWAALGLAVLVAIALARHALGGLGAAPVNAAMAAVACAQFVFGATPPAFDHGGQWAALALLAGGLVLVASGQVRWQSPVLLLGAAWLACLPFERGLGLATSAPWLLVAFFAWPDPATRGESAIARWVAAAFVGAVAVLAVLGASPRALPFAVLAGNLAVPVLDAWLAPRRRQPAA